VNPVTRSAITHDSDISADRKQTAISFLSGKADMPLRRLVVTQSEAAKMFSCSRITIYRMVQDGVLHPVSIRGALRYRVDELASLVQP